MSAGSGALSPQRGDAPATEAPRCPALPPSRQLPVWKIPARLWGREVAWTPGCVCIWVRLLTCPVFLGRVTASSLPQFSRRCSGVNERPYFTGRLGGIPA